MKITIISQNLQGMNDDGFVDLVRNYYRNHLRDTEILCFQEHKLRGAKLLALKDRIWRGAWYLAEEADIAYNNAMDGPGAGSGGLCMWVSPNIQYMVSLHGRSNSGRAQWVRLTGLPGGDLSLLNVYAPNNTAARCLLWRELTETLPTDCRWVLVGDWNFVERPQDKSRNNTHTMTVDERISFELLTSTLGVSDSFPAASTIRYSWDNKRAAHMRTLARLDRIYTPEELSRNTKSDEYSILGDSSLSDHLPVRRKLVLEEARDRRSPYVMNARYLKELEVQTMIRQEWSSRPNLPFFGKIRRCIRRYKRYCIAKAVESRCKEDQLRKQVEVAITELQKDPVSEVWQDRLATCTAELQHYEKSKAEGQKLRSRIKWKGVGDRSSKEFFQASKERSTASHITELADSRGQTHTSQDALQHICKEYYSALYEARSATPVTIGAKHQTFRYLSDKLSPEMKRKLQAPIQLSELKLAIDNMCVGKSPGPDGLILEFYKEFWQLIGEEYLSMVQLSIQTGKFPPGVTTGMIALLHKGGERKALTNWRPITLLNLSYKIFAKALQLRLQPILSEIIGCEQSAFLPLRFILDNILLTQETLAWADQSRQDLLFLKLDFSKAFDMIDWEFLFEAMSLMGFPGEFLGMIKLLFHDAEACVKVNGFTSESFRIKRGVRQGCPVAPYLFIIAAEVLNIMVMAEMVAGRVKGIELPFGNRQQIIAQYADDTSFTLRGEKEPVRNLIYILETFCAASGLVLNWGKSSGHWKSHRTMFRPQWTEHLGVTWAEEEDVGKLLGAPFGLSLTSGDINDFLYERIRKKLTHWSATMMNLTGRAVIVNSVLLGACFYFFSIWGGTKQGIARIKSLMINYLASGGAQRARAKVSWIQCCQERHEGGINLINPEDAVAALMVKWVLKALEPGATNLHELLRFRLSLYQPYPGGRWQPSLEYFTIKGHRSRQGSLAWNRAAQAWKSFLPNLHFVPPKCIEDLLSCDLWSCPGAPLIGPGFSKARAANLHTAGLCKYRDAMRDTRFIDAAEAQLRFGLKPEEHGAWEASTHFLSRKWRGMAWNL
jgi:exonuclease III